MRTLLFTAPDQAPRQGGRELIDEWQADDTTTIWVDMEEVTDEERKTLLEGTFGLHPLAVQDALRKRHPPKCERFGDRLFLMLRGLDARTTDIEFGVIQISMFVGPRFFLTRRTGQSLNTDALWTETAQRESGHPDPSALTLDLAGRVVRRYVPLLLGLEPRLEHLEREIFERPNDTLLEEISRYKSRLTQLRRTFVYHEQVLHGLRETNDAFFSDEQHHHIVDIHEQAQRSMSLTELYYSLVDDLQNGYIALASHRLNQVMRVLTVITVIFVPLSFLAGVYGMNFEVMPELKLESGYYGLLGVMAVVVAVQLVFFRLRRWI